ncbi:MAG: hypothetical protein FJ301_09960 [Planctomycetes bacterium]|nr:hypothetical protein [Planctomycetota bacterium]
MHSKFGDRVEFLFVYCREAHPVDGVSPGAKTMIEDPITNAERREVASKFVEEIGFAMPALLDQVDDAVSKAYASFPDRLYLVGTDGKIAYAGARGPLGFKPAELEKAIELALAPPNPTKRRDK